MYANKKRLFYFNGREFYDFEPYDTGPVIAGRWQLNIFLTTLR